MKEVEIGQIDTRFEELRLKDKEVEKVLLSSILEQGIRDPLQCVVKPEKKLILLDGFKRLRCAVKLKIAIVPVVSAGNNETDAILGLLRSSTAKGLSILEQSALVDELNRSYGLSIPEIARHLERSRAWVSVRLGLMDNMSSVVKEAVFSGRFPVRSYMYTLRSVTRVTKIKKSDIDNFVTAVSGKELSIRAIDVLARGFFYGGANIREQIQQGNLDWTLNHLLQETKKDTDSVSEPELKTLKDLKLAHGCLNRIPYQLKDSRLKSPDFFSQAHLLVEGILNKTDFFITGLDEFYRRRQIVKPSSPLKG
ncbi:MAG: chromosome partitioning protein ParB [Candidatus Omnitrophica bacterium]|nr:chromosome partitioning protein ParB [Candidatus Omnitrophota bacterium]